MMIDSLNDVVVSTRVSSTSQNKGQSVLILTADQIRALPVTTLDELLRYLPGMDMQQRGPFGTQSDINARGSRFNQNLVVVNGIPANDPLTGHFNGNFLVSPGEIERIEIVRGPSSLAYGGSSIGVTIHIYTYGFDATPKDTAHMANKVRLSFGSYGQQDMEYDARFHTGRFYVGGSIWNYNHTGIDRSDDQSVFLRKKSYQLVSDSTTTYLRRKQYGVYAGGEITKNIRFAIRGFISESEFDARNFYTASLADRSIEWVDRNKGEAVLFYSLNANHKMDFRYSFLQTKDKFEFIPSAVNRHDSRLHTVQWNNQVRKGRSTFAFGLQGMKGELESNDRGNREKQFADVYAIASHLFGSTGISYGIRLQLDDENQLNYVPQVWFSHYIDRVVLRGGASIATRSATYTERFVSTGLSFLSPGRNLGNPLLSDEMTINYEAGADWKATKGLTVGLTAWLRSSTDLIDYILTRGSEIRGATNISDTGYYFYATNLGAMDNLGTEFTLSHKGEISGFKWQYMVGYSFNHLLKSQDFEDTKYLLTSVRHLVNANVVVSKRWMRFTSTVLIKDRNKVNTTSTLPLPTSRYLVWNPAVGAVVPGGYIEFSVRNVLNTEFFDITGVPQPGRWFMVSVKTEF